MSFDNPYTNFHEINLNKFLKAVKNLLGGHGGELLQKKSNIPFDYEWTQIQTGGAVDSVNGQTGTVVLTASDVGALPDSTVIPQPANANPADLGTSAQGSSTRYARQDHVHKMPSASDVGALPDSTVIPQPANANPADLGTSAQGSSTRYARQDHVHKMPSASDVGALPVNGVADRAMSIPMGQLDAGSTSTVMTATITGITELKSGVLVWLKNGVVSSASDVTLNINNLGAKPIYSSQAVATAITTLFNINYTALLIYNETRVTGGCWDYVYGYDSNTNTIGYQIRTASMSLPMNSITYRYRLLFKSADGNKFVPANNSTSTNATTSRTPCQDKIDPFGDIFYYGTTASVAVGTRPSTSYLWQQYTLIIGYSFTVTLTAWKPVYLKCAPQTDGSAIIDSTTPIVQDLPTAEDGKIYIFLGVAYDSTHIELTLNHPIYYYKSGMIRAWTNPTTPTKADVGLGNVDNVQQYSATNPPPYPVTSVNGQTGAVTVSGSTPADALPEDLGTASIGTSTKYARMDHVHNMPSASDVGALPDDTPIPSLDWISLGTSSNSSTTVTYPATAKEILIKGKSTHSYNHAYINIIPVSAISNVEIIGVGGYYYSTNDFGYANVNHDATNRTLAFRNIRYASVTTGTFRFWYR